MTKAPIDRRTTASYAIGYAQGMKNDDAFRNPCSGNPDATQDHYIGFINGQAARVRGSEIEALKPIARTKAGA